MTLNYYCGDDKKMTHAFVDLFTLHSLASSLDDSCKRIMEERERERERAVLKKLNGNLQCINIE
jgi:hypothetical protein